MSDTLQGFINPFEEIDVDSLKTHVRYMVNRFDALLSENLARESEKPEVTQAILYRIDYTRDSFSRYYTFLPTPPTRYCIVFSVIGPNNSIHKIKKRLLYSQYDYLKMSLFEGGATSNFIVDCYKITKQGEMVNYDITGLVDEWEIFVKDVNCNFEKSFGYIILNQWKVVYDIGENKSVEISQSHSKLGPAESARRFLQDKGLPPDLKWKDIKFILRSNDYITIEVPSRNWQTRASYHQLEMADHRKVDEPSKLWIALRVLCQCNGQLNWHNPESVQDLKTISRLNTFMKDAFNIDDKFVKTYSKKHGYVTKSALVDRRDKDGDGGPQNLDSVLSSDSDPEWRIRDEQET